MSCDEKTCECPCHCGGIDEHGVCKQPCDECDFPNSDPWVIEEYIYVKEIFYRLRQNGSVLQVFKEKDIGPAMLCRIVDALNNTEKIKKFIETSKCQCESDGEWTCHLCSLKSVIQMAKIKL